MNRIKELRKEQKVSQAELAKFIGISRQELSFYETGRRNPRQDMWQTLANYFGVSAPYLQGAYSKKEIAEIAHELFPLGDTIGNILNRSWDTVPMKWLLEKPELNASEEDVKNIIRMYFY